MNGQPALSETVESVMRQLVGVEHGERRCIVKTPLSFPSGSLVAVKVTNGGVGYSVSDMASGFEEAKVARAVKAFNRLAPGIAAESGVDCDGRAFLVRNVSRDQLAGAIIAVANCAQAVAILISHKQAALDKHDLEERLFDRLERVFGKFEPHKTIVGDSGMEWDVDAVVRTATGEALFEAVSPVRQSIYATVAKYHDIARLPHPPVRLALVPSRTELGPMLGVLAQASSVIEYATPDATVVQFAKAA